MIVVAVDCMAVSTGANVVTSTPAAPASMTRRLNAPYTRGNISGTISLEFHAKLTIKRQQNTSTNFKSVCGFWIASKQHESAAQ